MTFIPILKVSQGGTGSSTAAGARTNLGVPATTAVILRDGSQAFTADQSFGGFKATSLADPTSAQDAATKAYVDSVASGLLDFKNSARAATTGNIASLAGGAPDTVDGVALAVNDRVLVKNQTTGSQNGIYTVQTVGTGADGTWVRASDADVSAEVTAGLFLWVTEGTVAADTGWVLTTNDPITLGTTSLTFVQFTALGQITAGAGLTKTGNTLDVVGTADRITVNADSVDIASTYAGQTSIVTLGTITTGTWNGTDIAVADGGTGSSTASGARSNLAAAPSAAQYVVVALDGELSAERVLTGTANRITIADGGANGNITLDIGTDVVTLTGTQTLTNKTLTAPVLNQPVIKYPYASKTANYTAVAADEFLNVDATSGAITITLTAAATMGAGKYLVIKKTDSSANAVTIDANGSETIDGATTYVLDVQYQSVSIFTDGSNWFIE